MGNGLITSRFSHAEDVKGRGVGGVFLDGLTRVINWVRNSPLTVGC